MEKITPIILGTVIWCLISSMLADQLGAQKHDAPQPKETPVGTVQGLYEDSLFFGARHHIRGPALDHLSACISAKLITHIKQCNAKIEAWLKDEKNSGSKLPISEGAVCISNYEGADTFEIGEAVVEGDRAEVPVSLSYSERGTTVQWVDVAILQMVDGVWLLDDIHFKKDSSNTLRNRLSLEK